MMPDFPAEIIVSREHKVGATFIHNSFIRRHIKGHGPEITKPHDRKKQPCRKKTDTLSPPKPLLIIFHKGITPKHIKSKISSFISYQLISSCSNPFASTIISPLGGS